MALWDINTAKPVEVELLGTGGGGGMFQTSFCNFIPWGKLKGVWGGDICCLMHNQNENIQYNDFFFPSNFRCIFVKACTYF